MPIRRAARLKCFKKSDDGLKMHSNSSKPRFPPPRIISFLSVFSTTFLAATWFVCATWDHFWQTASLPVWQIIFPAMTLVFVATTILGRRYSNLWLRLGYRISAIWLGVLNYSFFAAGRHGAFPRRQHCCRFISSRSSSPPCFLEVPWSRAFTGL
jgi:hypothetical protein